MDIKINRYTVVNVIVVCLMLYAYSMLDRAIALHDLIFNSDTNSASGIFILLVAICISDMILRLVRPLDLIFQLDIYEVNILHAISNIMMTVLGFMTGLGHNLFFILFVIFAITGTVYDIMYNFLVAFMPKYCFNHFKRVKVRLHCYTKKGYEKCITYSGN